MPIAVLTAATRPKIASANNPRPTRRTKNAPRIALKRVKTLAATMLETERGLSGSTGPRRERRFCASADDSPSIRISATASFIPVILAVESRGVDGAGAERRWRVGKGARGRVSGGDQAVRGYRETCGR